jgi:glutathione reductase (NADPH)
MDTLPSRIVFVGGGYIGAEFSHLAARAGARVTVLQHGPRMLAPFDPDLVAMLMDRFPRDWHRCPHQGGGGSHRVARRGVFVPARTPEGPLAVEADLAVHAGGRAPDFAALNLAAAEIASENGRLRLNESR